MEDAFLLLFCCVVPLATAALMGVRAHRRPNRELVAALGLFPGGHCLSCGYANRPGAARCWLCLRSLPEAASALEEEPTLPPGPVAAGNDEADRIGWMLGELDRPEVRTIVGVTALRDLRRHYETRLRGSAAPIEPAVLFGSRSVIETPVAAPLVPPPVPQHLPSRPEPEPELRQEAAVVPSNEARSSTTCDISH